jgi:LysM repeat protein
MKKSTLAVIALALLLVALMAGCRRAKPAVVSDVETTPTIAAAVATGRTVTSVASPTPTSEGTPETTPSPKATTPIPTTTPETARTATPTSTPIPTAIPTAVPTAVPTAAPTTAPSAERTHVVQPGENLFRIALHYGMTYTGLAAANGIVNPDLIIVGQELTIPAAGTTSAETTGEGTHVVQPGENLFRIALEYGVTVEALAVANGISNVNLIYPGQELVIP